jgi:FKBP-type peptidyl-prolyl cis-trans isomerase 2
MIKGFDMAVKGLSVGESKKVRVEPGDAYGELDAAKVVAIPVSQARGAELEPGMQVGHCRGCWR